MDLFVVSSHYPNGTWEEAYLTTEITVLGELFDHVTLLPLKDLPGCRATPSNIEVLPALIGLQRWTFFVKQLAIPRTWKFVLSALRDVHAQGRLAVKALPNCLKFACYRAGIASHPRFREFVSKPEGRVVYGYWAHFPALAALEAHDRGLASCVRYHSADIYEDQLKWVGHVQPWRSELRQKIDMHAFVSEHGRSYFLALPYEPKPKRTEVHLLGSPDFGPTRNRVPVDPANLVMVSVSTITPTKRVHLIARLAQALAKEGRVVWHHFGTGSEPEAVRELGQQVDGLTVILHGVTPNTEIQQFFRDTEIDFFVNLSLAEGAPVSIMEAMNADIPVIATDVGGVPELVLNGRSGMTVTCDDCLDSDRLAERVRHELAPGGLLALSRPREVWEERWNAHKNATKFYESLCELMIPSESAAA